MIGDKCEYRYAVICNIASVLGTFFESEVHWTVTSAEAETAEADQ